MGDRHSFYTLQFHDINQDPNHNQLVAGQSFDHTGRTIAPENVYFSHPVENLSRSGFNNVSQLNTGRRLMEQPPTNFRLDVPQVHTSLSRPSNHFLPDCPASGSLVPGQEMNAAHYQSGHFNRHMTYEVENGPPDGNIDSGRGPLKRKGHSSSGSYERGGTSKARHAGSSSNSFEDQQVNPSSDYINCSPVCSPVSIGLPPNRGSCLSIGVEDSSRNVRSRSRMNLGTNPRTYSSDFSSHPYCSTSTSPDDLVPVNIGNLNMDTTPYERHHTPAHGAFQPSANSFPRHEMHHYHGRSAADGECYQESNSRRIHTSSPRYLHGFQSHLLRDHNSSYPRSARLSHRSALVPPMLGQASTSENGQGHFVDTNPSRYRRPFYGGGWNSSWREGRSNIAVERHQPLSNAVDPYDRMGSEASTMFGRSHSYSSTNLFDQYREMRLDIDNMSYEELLALGERIGNVNTGLSDGAILECLMETTYPSNGNQEEASCAICLEKYKEMHKVGRMKNCGHDYHVDCVKKWLSVKNVCPICKAPALAE